MSNEVAIRVDGLSKAYRIRRCLVVGEVAPAHDGSLGTAHAFIDAHRGFALAANQSEVNGQKSRGLAVRLGHLLAGHAGCFSTPRMPNGIRRVVRPSSRPGPLRRQHLLDPARPAHRRDT